MNTSQVNVTVPRELKQAVAIDAIKSGLTLREYVIQALEARLSQKNSIAA